MPTECSNFFLHIHTKKTVTSKVIIDSVDEISRNGTDIPIYVIH